MREWLRINGLQTHSKRDTRNYPLVHSDLRARAFPPRRATTMLAFKMKRPLQEVRTDRALGDKIDNDTWGATGRDILQKVDGMRMRVAEASQSYTEKGAEECRAAFGKYQELCRQAGYVCKGVSLKDANLTFKWCDAFDTANHHMEPDWSFERACVVFNLAASISFLGTHQDRTTPTGLKTACNLYQQAAGALAEVQAMVSAAAWRSSPDLSSDTLGALQTLMLAQAQKNFVEKAQADGMSDKILALLNAECAGLYEEVGRRFDEAKARQRPISAMAQEWLDVVEWNRKVFDGLQHHFLAKVADAEHKYGDALSRHTYAANKTAEAVKACAGAPPALQEQFKRAHQICLDAYNGSKRDNDSIYHEKVPHISTLPKPERKSMVKPQRPAELDNDPSFEALLPPSVSRGPSMEPAAAAAAPTSVEGAMGAIQLDDAGDGPPPPSFADAEAAGLVELTNMGFDLTKAKDALARCNGSVQEAANLLAAES